MARVVALIDRRPDDTDWKGAFLWRLILSLAESQHEVLVLTTADPAEIPLTHPRLTIARPVENWRADGLPRLTQALLQFRPEILHTFALQPQRLWGPLTVWPYLNALVGAFPRVRRFSTLLDAQDFEARDSARGWYEGSDTITVFTANQANQARLVFPQSRLELAPLDFDLPDLHAQENENPMSDYLLVPSPISDWVSPDGDLIDLGQELAREPELQLKIVGGWGDCLASERRRGWETLAAVSGQVQMLAPMHLPAFLQLAAGARSLWLRGLQTEAWRTLIARHIAGPRLENLRGSTANFISRLYTLNC